MTPSGDLAELITLAGRCALVTGGAQGFGLAIARRLAQAGAAVVLTDIDLARAQSAASSLGPGPAKVHALGLDVRDEDALAEVLDEGDALFGGVDILINNAGLYTHRPIAELTIEDFRGLFEVNVLGAASCALQVAARLRERSRPGSIVNIASVDALRSSGPGLSHYTTSKHAIAGLTRSLAVELGPFGIRVNAVCPGVSLTEGLAQYMSGSVTQQSGADALDAVRIRTPLRRLCRPDDVARSALFLTSELGSFLTGVMLPVDGGYLEQPLEGYGDERHAGEAPDRASGDKETGGRPGPARSAGGPTVNAALSRFGDVARVFGYRAGRLDGLADGPG